MAARADIHFAFLPTSPQKKKNWVNKKYEGQGTNRAFETRASGTCSQMRRGYFGMNLEPSHQICAGSTVEENKHVERQKDEWSWWSHGGFPVCTYASMRKRIKLWLELFKCEFWSSSYSKVTTYGGVNC